jgi:hypothetical protein
MSWHTWHYIFRHTWVNARLWETILRDWLDNHVQPGTYGHTHTHVVVEVGVEWSGKFISSVIHGERLDWGEYPHDWLINPVHLDHMDPHTYVGVGGTRTIIGPITVQYTLPHTGHAQYLPLKREEHDVTLGSYGIHRICADHHILGTYTNCE